MVPTDAILVPAQCGRAVWVEEGCKVTVTDVAGQQIGDTWALLLDRSLAVGSIGRSDQDGRPRAHSIVIDWLSAGQTRRWTGKLFPDVGDSFYTYGSHEAVRAILTLEEDASPGDHDMLYPACDPGMYREGGHTRSAMPSADHPNCRTNYERALASVGVHSQVVPQPVNLFQCSPAVGGALEARPSRSRAGDHVSFRVRCDCLFVVTACSVDYDQINGPECSSLSIQIEA